MKSHLHRDLDSLKKELLSMGGMVEEATNLAISAVVERRTDLAQQVMQGDDRIDSKELELEDTCLKMLALHQPVAGDLRFIVAVMKVNNDLERIGDLALNIAERAVGLARLPTPSSSENLRDMADRVRTMLRESLDALVNQDPQLARKACADDEAVDRLHRERFEQLLEVMRANPDDIDAAVQLLSVSRNLERIADHATNIAEDVVFMVEGEVIRHQQDEASPG